MNNFQSQFLTAEIFESNEFFPQSDQDIIADFEAQLIERTFG